MSAMSQGRRVAVFFCLAVVLLAALKRKGFPVLEANYSLDQNNSKFIDGAGTGLSPSEEGKV